MIVSNFFRTNKVEANLMKHVLSVYGKAFGQCVNYAKSSISFSMNVKEDIVQQICSIIGVTTTSNHGPYLGLPSHIGRKRSDVFRFVKEKVWKKL